MIGQAVDSRAASRIAADLIDISGNPALLPESPATRAAPPLPQLVADPAEVRTRADGALAHLGTDELRVGLSWTQYMFGDRLWGILFSAAHLHGVVPHIADLRAPIGGGSRWPLTGTPRMTSHLESSPEELADALLGQIQLLMATLADTIGHCGKVNPRILLGNTSTGIALPTRSLMGRGDDDALVHLATLVAERGGYADWYTGQLPGPIMRRTCCLYYRAARRRPCGDCALKDSAVVRAFQESAPTPSTPENA